MKRLVLALLLAPSVALAQSPDRPGASVMVTSVQQGDILAANNIDKQIPANLAGRLAFKILAHEWVALNDVDINLPLPNSNGMTVLSGIDAMLEDGQSGEMARASLAGMIGYTPQSLDTAIQALLREMGIETKDFAIQRSQYNGPEWSGTISLRDTGRISVALTRLHGNNIPKISAGAGLQCFSFGEGQNSKVSMTAIVSGAASPEGCLAAANSAIELSDKRLANHVFIAEETKPVTNPGDLLSPTD